MRNVKAFNRFGCFSGSLLMVLAAACAPDVAPPTVPPQAVPLAAVSAGPAAEPVSDRPSPADLVACVAPELQKGRPLVFSIHVALCDNASQGIVPVPAAIGDGDRPDTNLYWGARYGLRTVFDRAPGWTRETRLVTDKGGVLEFVEYRRRAEPQGAWREAGVTMPFDVRLRAVAWRGRAMAEALTAFTKEVLDPPAETLVLGGDRRIPLNDPARVVGFVGHNGLMDLPPPVWPFKALRGADKPALHRGVFVLACKSRPYFAGELLGPRVHNLAMTQSLMAPESYLVEALVEAFVNGEDAAGLGKACAAAYAKHQKVSETAARRIFAVGP
jgi:hypothetical protein